MCKSYNQSSGGLDISDVSLNTDTRGLEVVRDLNF